MKLSLNGLSMWASTLNSIHAFGFTNDATQMTFATASSAVAVVGHAVKRWTLRNK